MPELPEVEVITRGLAHILCGADIVDVHITDKKMRFSASQNFKELLLGQKILKIWRRAKYIIIDLSNSYSCIIHLGMSGRLYCANAYALDAHNHMILKLAKHGDLIFYDPRRFGFYNALATEDLPQHKLFQRLGLEPLESEYNISFFSAVAAKTRINIKKLLMDSSIVVGIGNIYASEILFLAKVAPTRPANTLNMQEIQLLIENTRFVLQRAIEYGGSTLKDYRDGSGKKGNFQNHFVVYGRKCQPCVNCSSKISVIKINGRSSYFCHSCQT